jgi:hypothetical protein
VPKIYNGEKTGKKPKQMKNCSPFLGIKEMQIKTTLRFHFPPVRIATIMNANNKKCW